jgi:hypothetical protein
MADISGAVNVKYSSPAKLWVSDLQDKRQIFCSGYTTIDGTDYDFVISFFFADKVEKTGTFNFYRKHSDKNFDVAYGVLAIGADPNRRIFISDSGSVTVTELVNSTMKGTFNFYAKDTTGNGSLVIKNGILDIK